MLNRHFRSIAVIMITMSITIPLLITPRKISAQQQACFTNIESFNILETNNERLLYQTLSNVFSIDCSGGGWRGRCNWASVIDLWVENNDGTWTPFNSWCTANSMSCGDNLNYQEPFVALQLPPGNYWVLGGIYKGDCSNVGPPIEQRDLYFSIN